MKSQQIIWGLDELGQILNGLGCGRILLVADSSFDHLPVKDRILSSVRPRGIFNAFHPNPSFGEIREGVKAFRGGGFDSIVAVGGGSSIDVAKCIKLAVKADEGVACLIPPLVSERASVAVKPSVPLVAIPTTAGTGSESTANAVHYYGGVKQTVAHPCILPDVAILEPQVLITLPEYQKKSTMMDALCQGIESWWSVEATLESRTFSRIAVETIMQDWRRYIFHNVPNAARSIMLAANYAGRAINIAHTTAAHAMSYKLGSMFGLPHGHSVAVCLPEIWEYMLGAADQHAMALFGQIAHTMGASDPAGAIAIFREMMAELGLEGPVAGDRKDECAAELASCVNTTRLRNNPVKLSEEVCKGLYMKILH